ncbi:MAG: c-type cytochrome [Sulfitobacter sp.]
MLKRAGYILVACAALGAGAAWVLSRPADLPADFTAPRAPDAQAGALVFAAGGCRSCHSAPGTQSLAGGTAFPSDFGTFYAPNISPDPDHGIGGWTQAEFARALTLGVSPAGQHYYPAFPYTSYSRMTPQDVADLFAHLQTLPASDSPSKPHDVGFPFNIRRGLGLWKWAFAHDDDILQGAFDAQITRGRYLVEALAHCGECHTPRSPLGALTYSQWLSGAPNPSGKGRIPGITPAALDWSQADLAEYFTSGFTPDFDSAGGEMAEVIENLSQLPDSDRAAIAAYLKALP